MTTFSIRRIARYVGTSADWMVRTNTAARRTLPDYVIIGAQKAGTSSFYRYLLQHEDVRPAFVKEVHFFDMRYGRGANWYRAHFPLSSDVGTRRITGEASPYYLYHPAVPDRMRSLVPDARLIVLLRDPVHRAYSHYHHERKEGTESLPFDEALDAEAERLAAAGTSPEAYEDEAGAHRHHSYLARGRYVEQLRRFFDVFPRDRVLVLFSEAFFQDPQLGFDEATEFLGLRPARLLDATPWNVGRYERGAVPRERELREAFAVPNQELATLLGRPLPW